MSKNKKESFFWTSYSDLMTFFLLDWLTLGIMYIVVMCKQLYLQNAVNRTYNELNSL